MFSNDIDTIGFIKYKRFLQGFYDGSVRRVAVVHNSDKTRTMEVYTDLPGMQFLYRKLY
ncbi:MULTISPECIES: hypothetical protein [Eisenbergiella]|uniref:hypothetical protein n=1 Tax=Eisenbergiella TaxID=1432051 RepID=UPI0023F3D68B|nr:MULTISPECIES: hypothetical protein [Eisenbergiella]MCI6705433.1 hypothetical protein [Eisenbergiella massiliensis]MDY5525775.1 hypothetical protein [Eisenbergiella porci]